MLDEKNEDAMKKHVDEEYVNVIQLEVLAVSVVVMALFDAILMMSMMKWKKKKRRRMKTKMKATVK